MGWLYCDRDERLSDKEFFSNELHLEEPQGSWGAGRLHGRPAGKWAHLRHGRPV